MKSEKGEDCELVSAGNMLSICGEVEDIFKRLKLAQDQYVARMLPKSGEDSSKKEGFEPEPHRARTCNLLIKSQLLYQLS